MTSSTSTDPAVLVLEDGTVARGVAYGARGTTLGEIVFSTGMTGYQETLTDPSYHRQIVVMTAPHVGNTGVNDDDPESRKIWVAGYVLRDPARRASSWRSRGDLADELAEQGVVGIAEVDTRFLTRHLRELGVMRAGIFSGDDLVRDGVERGVDDLVQEVRGAPLMAGADLAREVTTAEAYTVEPRGLEDGADPVATVVAVDLGIKSMTPVRLAERGVRVHVVPQSTTFAEVEALLPAGAPGGVFFSNGPGDPSAATAEIDLLRQVLDRRIPFFGICFGNQLFGRALGYGTYKLGYGHRGINQPVKDRTTGKVEVTAQNHGFAVDAPLDAVSTAPLDTVRDDQGVDGARYGRVIVSHVGLNDQVVEGLTALDLPAFSVQYHPEAAAGPHDSAYLFDRFVDLMTTREPVTVPPAALAALAGGTTGEKEN
ncbi:glutamine-hydrolyzing carbamoyl-phosphate synthase small subunit [Isoptericola halotolerans]|uniref:Carbamoyl phosphate synthase small chain n=1 Tax=Isoptericola halotolerans TaxID=300560 RepID=A0ABX2A554_9MICO|nr:carbamoyl-phosphate synthase small subunit [Isoptericola halotolerans]